jgi:hypothetical protein
MLFALDKDNKKVHIDNTIRSEDYFCPCCGSKMVLRMGDIRIHHFAHPSDSICRDTWHYDMTEWHYEWQNRFPKEYQEIVKTKDGQKHRADVLIESEKVVFEFQHSPLSPDEFENRNSFYNSLGYKVIWIFDAEEQYQNEQIENYRSDLWSWKRPKRTFDFYDCKNKLVQLYLQLDNSDIDLIKVTWCTDDNGLSRFATDGYGYDEESIVHMFDDDKKQNEPTECKLSELFDKMIQLNSRDHTTYYFGCPISSTHKCADSNIDIPDEKFAEIMPCMECKYQCESYDYYNYAPICKKRFLDLNLDGNTIVKVESRDKNGFINKISYLKDNKRIYIDMPTFQQNITKDVYTLWEENHCTVATFRNVRTGFYIRIYKNPKEQKYKYGKVYGCFSKDKYSFPKTSSELYGVDRPEWVIDWFK